jgi:photosystem II stability/assembly factor-like uncharacterized protein
VRTLAATVVHHATTELGYLGSIVVAGERVFACGGTYSRPTLLVSEDRGGSFGRWPVPQTPGLRDVHIDDDGTVWVVGEWGLIANTTDSGVTWKTVAITHTTACLYSIVRDHQQRMWILGDGGLVLRAKQSGKRFTRIDNHSTARMLYMLLEGDHVWLLDSGGMLQRNRGRGFEPVKLAAMRTERPLCALVRTPAKTLLLLGDRGLVLRSINDGASWKKISVESRNDLEKLLVTPYGCFVVGDHGSLLVSHDDGRSFQGLDIKSTAHLWSIALVDGDLVIGAEQGQLLRIYRRDLADLLHHVYTKKDPVLSDLAAHLRDGVEGADLVLEDALRERELW